MAGKKSLSDVEHVLQDHKALPHLAILVDAGCNRGELLAAMEISFLADESWPKLVGMDLRAFKTALVLIKHCARMIDRLNRSELIYRLSIEHRKPWFVGLHESPTLPERLREYATQLDSLRGVYGPKLKVRQHAWKAWVVAMVTEETRKPHDREVSSLIAAVLDDSKYTERAHQAWRLKHSDLIEMMKEKLPKHRRKKALQSPPL